MPENGVLSLRPKSHDIKLQTDAETKLRDFLRAVADITAGSQPKIRHGDGWRRSWGRMVRQFYMVTVRRFGNMPANGTDRLALTNAATWRLLSRPVLDVLRIRDY